MQSDNCSTSRSRGHRSPYNLFTSRMLRGKSYKYIYIYICISTKMLAMQLLLAGALGARIRLLSCLLRLVSEIEESKIRLGRQTYVTDLVFGSVWVGSRMSKGNTRARYPWGSWTTRRITLLWKLTTCWTGQGRCVSSREHAMAGTYTLTDFAHL